MTALATTRRTNNRAILEAGPPANNTPLADVDYCRAVIERYEAQRPCGETQGGKIGAILTAAYPTMKAHSPAEYARLVAATIGKYPERVAIEAMERLTERCRFLPTRADVFAACESVMDQNRRLVRVARLHLEEAEKRDRESARSAEIEASRRHLRETLGESWDAWWALPIARRCSGSVEDFAAGYRAARNKAEFCERWGR